MNERIGKFKKISVASVCQRRVQHRRFALDGLPSRCPFPKNGRSPGSCPVLAVEPPRQPANFQRHLHLAAMQDPIKAHQIHQIGVCYPLLASFPSLELRESSPTEYVRACTRVKFWDTNYRGPVNSSPPSPPSTPTFSTDDGNNCGNISCNQLSIRMGVYVTWMARTRPRALLR